MRESCADLVILEIGRSAGLRESPPGDAVRNLLADPPCDVLVVRNYIGSHAAADYANEQ